MIFLLDMIRCVQEQLILLFVQSGASFTWDGFRRSIIAMIFGIRYPKYSICVHPKNWSDEKCRAQEAFGVQKT